MLSRVAENLYWLGRYLERADNLARLADAHALARAEALAGDEASSWFAIVETLGASEAFSAARAAQPELRGQDFVISSLEYPQSVRSVINQARTLARELREQVSREVFEEINRLYLAGTDLDQQHAREYTAIVRRRIASVVGLFDHTVLHTEGSRWFRCGLFLERADMTSRIIDSKYFVVLPTGAEVDGPVDRAQWKSVLRAASALEAFRRRYREAVGGLLVTDLLLFDADFPRSLAFCVQELRENFEAAMSGARIPQVVPPTREIILLQLDLQAADIRGVVTTGLHAFLDLFQGRLIAIDSVLRDHLFQPVPEVLGVALGASVTMQE